MGDKATLGRLYVDDDQFCYTLEDKDRQMENDGVKVYGKTCIPRGTYKVVIDYSNHFGRMLPHILDVPSFEGIRIHPGNTDADTEGCILVGGKPTGENFIPHSRTTFESLFSALEEAEQAGENITITVT